MSKLKHIALPFGIDIQINGKEWGRVSSNLRVPDPAFVHFNNFVTCIEQMILKHTMLGLNVTSQKYIKGIEEAITQATERLV